MKVPRISWVLFVCSVVNGYFVGFWLIYETDYKPEGFRILAILVNSWATWYSFRNFWRYRQIEQHLESLRRL